MSSFQIFVKWKGSKKTSKNLDSYHQIKKNRIENNIMRCQ